MYTVICTIKNIKDLIEEATNINYHTVALALELATITTSNPYNTEYNGQRINEALIDMLEQIDKKHTQEGYLTGELQQQRQTVNLACKALKLTNHVPALCKISNNWLLNFIKNNQPH